MTEPTEPKEDDLQPKASAPRRWLFWLRAVWLLALTPVVFALVAALMVIDRDIRAPSWIVERIEARATELLNGGDLEFGEISLRIGRDLHPTARMTDLKLRDANGMVISQIPVVEGLMSPRGLILQQDVLMQDVRIIGAQIYLRRTKDGSVAVSFGSGAQNASSAPSLPQLLEQFDALLERPPMDALETVRATGLVVNFDDARAARSWVVDGGAIALEIDDDQLSLRGDFALLSGRAQVTNVVLSFDSPVGSRVAQMGLVIKDAVASDIAAQTPALSWLQDVNAPVSAALRTSLDADGALGPLNATLELGAGALQPNPATAPVKFDAAKAYLTFDPSDSRISFGEVTVETDWGRMSATGNAYMRDFKDGLPQTLLSQFDLTDISFDPPGLYDTPKKIARAAIDLRLTLSPFSLEIGQLVIKDGMSRLTVKGDVSAVEQGWQVAIDAGVDQIDFQTVLDFWPVSVTPRARAWVAKNISSALLLDGQAGLRLGLDTPVRFAADIGFKDTQFQFMRTMPTITQAAGRLSVINRSFAIGLDAGKAIAPQGGQMDLAGTNFQIPTLGIPNPPAIVDLQIASSITAVTSVLNQPPFRFLERAKLPVVLATGRAAVSARIDMPLMPVIPPERISFDFTAQAQAVRSNVLIPNRRLTAPNLLITADRQGMKVTGPVRVGTVPLNANWSRSFARGEGGRSQLDAQIEISPRFLTEFGIGLPDGMITGAGQAALTLDLREGQPTRFALQSDLQGVGVSIPALSWSKSDRSTAALSVNGILGAAPQITDFAMNGAGLRAEGRIDLNSAGGLDAARFNRLSVGQWLNVPLTLRGRGRNRPPAVEIVGGNVDLRRVGFGRQGSAGGPLTINLDRLQVTDGIALTGFRGDFTTSGGFAGRFTAQVNGAAPLQGTVAPRDGRSAVRLTSSDAGALGRATGMMANGLGGALDLTLLPAGGQGSFDGTLGVTGLRVRDAPTMAALLDAISVVGLLQQLDGQGLAFEDIDAKFRLTPSQVIITEASAVGPGLGISIDGIYTLASKQLDLQGVISPFYLVNSIGSILTRRGEGLIGFNFNIGGSSDAPQVSVNPLSAFTPGMFRDIFRRPPPQVTE